MRRQVTHPRCKPPSMPRVSALAGAIVLALGVTAVSADDASLPQTGIYGEDSRYYGGPDYSQLRPGPSMGGRSMSGPASMPPASPNTTIYGPHSRYYGGPDYSQLRPGGPYHGPGMMRQGYMAPATPRTGIYGRDSRLYGGPDYSHLRPGFDQRRDRMGPGMMGPGMMMQGPQMSDRSAGWQYYPRVYDQLRPGPGMRGPGPDYDAQAAPETGIFGEESRRYGGPDFSQLKPTAAGPPPTEPDVQASPESTLYGEDSRRYGGSDYSIIRPDQSQ